MIDAAGRVYRAGYGRVRYDELQQELRPVVAVDIARPIGQRVAGKPVNQRTALERPVDDDGPALVCGERDAENGSPFHRCVFLGERYTISYAPSATVLKNIRDALARRGGPPGDDLIGLAVVNLDSDSAGEVILANGVEIIVFDPSQ